MLNTILHPNSILNLDTLTQKEIISDYKLACLSRELSILGRKEVLNGRAPFGIFGEGKEIATIAYAKYFQKGDWRSGYYRDQTFMMAANLLTPVEFFYQLYGETNSEQNPSSSGRQMNNHFATKSLNGDGSWKKLTEQLNSASDVSCTAGQLPRLLGLAYASKLYRENENFHSFKNFSVNGNEVAFGTLGDASTAQGHFWETINAAGVLQVPLALAIWDNGFGISVPTELQITKGVIAEAIKGLERSEKKKGILIYQVKGWDYLSLVETFKKGLKICRENHVPVVFHIEDMTQPQGHSSSGSHERYKSKERLQFEKDFDPILKMREWIINSEIAPVSVLNKLEKEAKEEATAAKKEAWKNYTNTFKQEKENLISIVENSDKENCDSEKLSKITRIIDDLKKVIYPIQKDMISAGRKILRYVGNEYSSHTNALQEQVKSWLTKNFALYVQKYSSHLHNETKNSALKVEEVKPVYGKNPRQVTGREVLRDNFDKLFEKYPLLVTFGEDTGKLGDVNKGLEGLQEKYGELRVTDTGIRETTIMGQGIGMALRGLRPIAEIQYLDYLIYGLEVLTDDLASTYYRTKGTQMPPLIIRTRGHRLQGIWHSGSPLGMIINSLRGIYICVPRNLTQASGFYNTLLEGQDPALVIEPLHSYTGHELIPENLGEFRIPLGVPDIVREGTDITIVTYGTCVHIALDAAEQLKEFDVSTEVVDVQTLLPFDRYHVIAKSLNKTNKVLFLDEDVPGGATAFMLQKVLEEQKGYFNLDAEPKTLCAKEHRPAYTPDGDYFSKPSADDVFEAVYKLMNEYAPEKYPVVFDYNQ
ncbi:thiamine pyrophosphate-dependent enzyme [Bacteroidota bacterium]